MTNYKEFSLLMRPSDDLKTTIFYVIDYSITVFPGCTLAYEGQIHTLGNLTTSSGYSGYYSDKGQWFYENHKGIVVASSDEELNSIPKLNKESFEWAHKVQNNKVFIEVIKDPTGIIPIEGKPYMFSLKTHPYSNTVNLKKDFKMEENNFEILNGATISVVKAKALLEQVWFKGPELSRNQSFDKWINDVL